MLGPKESGGLPGWNPHTMDKKLAIDPQRFHRMNILMKRTQIRKAIETINSPLKGGLNKEPIREG